MGILVCWQMSGLEDKLNKVFSSIREFVYHADGQDKEYEKLELSASIAAFISRRIVLRVMLVGPTK